MDKRSAAVLTGSGLSAVEPPELIAARLAFSRSFVVQPKEEAKNVEQMRAIDFTVPTEFTSYAAILERERQRFSSFSSSSSSSSNTTTTTTTTTTNNNNNGNTTATVDAPVYSSLKEPQFSTETLVSGQPSFCLGINTTGGTGSTPYRRAPLRPTRVHSIVQSNSNALQPLAEPVVESIVQPLVEPVVEALQSGAREGNDGCSESSAGCSNVQFVSTNVQAVVATATMNGPTRLTSDPYPNSDPNPNPTKSTSENTVQDVKEGSGSGKGSDFSDVKSNAGSNPTSSFHTQEEKASGCMQS